MIHTTISLDDPKQAVTALKAEQLKKALQGIMDFVKDGINEGHLEQKHTLEDMELQLLEILSSKFYDIIDEYHLFDEIQ